MGQQQDSISPDGKDADETGAAGARANSNAGRSDRKPNEQIDELRQELKRVADKQDKMGTWIKANIPKKEEAE